MAHEVTVIGAVNVDISGTPAKPLIPKDSNPGKIKVTFGGVGRNIAENLCRLGVSVEMITVLGEDLYAESIRKHCGEIGIGLTHALTVPGGNTSTYLCVNNEHGDMSVAVNDMEIISHLTKEYLATKLDVLKESKLVILDANLSAETIAFVAEHGTVPILADPVSVSKGQKMIPAFPHIHTMKPNLIEAEVMSGVSIQTKKDLEAAAQIFLQKGMTNVFISLGENGVYYSNGTEQGVLPCYQVPVINTTGGGDAFMAGMTKGMLLNKSIREIAAMGITASAICVQCDAANSKELTMDKMETMMKEYGGI